MAWKTKHLQRWFTCYAPELELEGMSPDMLAVFCPEQGNHLILYEGRQTGYQLHIGSLGPEGETYDYGELSGDVPTAGQRVRVLMTRGAMR